LASDEVVRARVRPPARADRAASGGAARRIAPARLRAGDGCGAAPGLLRAARRADPGRARRRERHAGRPGPHTHRLAARRGPAPRTRRGRRLGGTGQTDAPFEAGHAVRTRRAARAPRRGPLAPSPGGRAGRGDAASSVHHRAAARSRALPDGVRRADGLGGRAHGRPALHARAPGPARRRARDAARRPGHLPPGQRGGSRHARDPRRTLRGGPGDVGPHPGSRARARGGDNHGPGARVARPRCSARRQNRAVHHARLRVQSRGRVAHEFPSSALDFARPRHGVRRRRRGPAPVRTRDRRALPLLLLRDAMLVL